MGEVAIKAVGLTRQFGDVTAVDRVDLSVQSGEVYGFLGRNGAGKTSLIRMLLGLIRPSSGSVDIFGIPVGRFGGSGPWSRVGYLVEGPGLYPELTVADHLAIAARYRGMSAPAIERISARLDLARYETVRAKTLSQGNKQRLGLALALMHLPDLVVLDEPSNGLDPAGVVEVRGLLRELADGGVTVFMSSHNIEEVARVADRIGIIHEGRLIDEFATERLASLRAQLVATLVDERQCQLGLDAMRAAGISAWGSGSSVFSEDPAAVEHPEWVATVLVQAGAPPARLAVSREELEDYFLRVTEREVR